MNELLFVTLGIIGFWFVLNLGSVMIDQWINNGSYHGKHERKEEQ